MENSIKRKRLAVTSVFNSESLAQRKIKPKLSTWLDSTEAKRENIFLKKWCGRNNPWSQWKNNRADNGMQNKSGISCFWYSVGLWQDKLSLDMMLFWSKLLIYWKLVQFLVWTLRDLCFFPFKYSFPPPKIQICHILVILSYLGNLKTTCPVLRHERQRQG